MNPGKLNNRVGFWGIDPDSENEAGELDGKRKKLFSRWANIKRQEAVPVVIEGKNYMKITGTIMIRFMHGVDKTMEIELNGKMLSIDAVENFKEQSRWLRIHFNEVF